MLKTICVSLSFATLALSHSWITCTKYEMNEANLAELETYNPAKCKGFPRHFKDFDRGFGVDAGYNHQIDASGDNAAPCRTKFNDGTPYTDQYPMATYTPGEKVCLTWPTKNHVASSCNNPFIVDGGVKIYRSDVNPTGETTKANLQKNLVVDMGATATPANTEGQALYTRPGYQRCPKFCSNNDKAMCSQCFVVPNLPQGTYTFSWFWIFNAGQLYTSCWEAKVGAGGGSVGTGGGGDQTGGSDEKEEETPLGLDAIRFAKVPTTITAKDVFEVEIDYNVAQERMIVVDILSVPDYMFYGKGFAEADPSKQKVTIKVVPENSPPEFQNYILKGWIVSVEDFEKDPSTAYLNELSRIESPVTIGEKVVYSSTSSARYPPGAIAGAFFGGFVLCALIAVAVYFVKYGKKV